MKRLTAISWLMTSRFTTVGCSLVAMSGSSLQLWGASLHVNCSNGSNWDRGWGADMNQGLAISISHDLMRAPRERKQHSRYSCANLHLPFLFAGPHLRRIPFVDHPDLSWNYFFSPHFVVEKRLVIVAFVPLRCMCNVVYPSISVKVRNIIKYPCTVHKSQN